MLLHPHKEIQLKFREHTLVPRLEFLQYNRFRLKEPNEPAFRDQVLKTKEVK